MSDNKNVSVDFSGIFIPGLTLLFIGLKLLDKIDWSWWWVLSPIWIPIGIVAAIFLIVVIAISIVYLVEKIPTRKNKIKKIDKWII